MTFTSTPDDLASLCGPLVYSFADNAAPRTLEVEVADVMTGDIIAVKRLQNTSAGTVDIAPLLRNRLRLAPLTEAGFHAIDDRAPRIRVSVEGASVVRRFLANRLPLATEALVSSMPAERIIHPGERDELTLLPGITRIETRFTTASGTVTSRNHYSPYAVHPALFVLDTATAPEGVAAIEVRLYGADATVRSQLRYTVVPRPEGAVRVAWFGRRGSVEHYTFPICRRCAETQQRTDYRHADGSRQVAGTQFEGRMTLVSAYERAEVAAALAEIGTAPALWTVAAEGSVRAVEAIAADRIVATHGAPSLVEITLRSTLENRLPWS